MSHTFEWKTEYSVHVAEIDEQHKKLVKLIFELFNAINKNSAKEELGKILDELVEYAGYHFATEEKYFKKCNYEFAEEHIAEHHKFTEKVVDFQKKYKNNEIEISFELIDFLEDWLLEHLMTADQKYIKAFKDCGIE